MKATRMLVRLKHSMAEGEEFHAVLPDTWEGFREAVARGELKELGVPVDEILSD